MLNRKRSFNLFTRNIKSIESRALLAACIEQETEFPVITPELAQIRAVRELGEEMEDWAIRPETARNRAVALSQPTGLVEDAVDELIRLVQHEAELRRIGRSEKEAHQRAQARKFGRTGLGESLRSSLAGQ